MKKNTDIFSLLKADHRKVEALFSKLDKTTERASKTRQTLYSELSGDLRKHTTAEEKAIYPLLKEKELTEDIAFESVEEHDIVKFLLGKLDKTSCESKEWTAQITALKEAVQHHVEEEEESMFSKMKKAFSKEDLVTMAENFQAAKVEASPLEKAA